MATPLQAWQRETLYAKADIRANPWPDAFALRRFRCLSITTLKPSWSGARVGEFPDALEPISSSAEAAQITAIDVLASAQPGTYPFSTATNETLEIKVLDQQLPEKRIFPFYSEITSEDCVRALASLGLNEKPPNVPYTKQGPITAEALQLARSFGIEPVKQAQVLFDNPSADAAEVDRLFNIPYGYQDLVLNGAIAAPIIWCGSNSQPDQSFEPNQVFLQRINQLAPPGSMAWCADEPAWNGIGIGMDVDKAIKRVRLVQRHAPNLIPMITTGTTVLAKLQELAADLPIRYCIVQNDDSPDLLSNQKGSYFSCMAQGCGDDKKDGQLPQFPVAVVEGDPVLDFQAAIKLAYQNKAIFALYYKITLCLTTCWLPGGLYNEGGNGDGTAMYVHPSTGSPMPSIRMMHWHQAQQMVEKEIIETQALQA